MTGDLQPPPEVSPCAREPVHIPGAIQPHGAMLVLEPADLTITWVSDNAAAILGIEPVALLGRCVAQIAAIVDAAEIARSLARPELEDRNPFELRLASGAVLDAVAHRHDGRLILECEPQISEAAFQQAYFYNRIRTSLVRIRGAGDLHALCQHTAREVRQLTGFDRVVVYCFRPDASGEVVAEACADGAARYLGLRFPASDIPVQARALYAACRLRIIPAASYVPAQLVGLSDGRPVDLTHAVLRSISPVHREYMQNMGVTASLGISLMHDDRLWGLVTCNHESGARFIPYQVRTACALVGEVVSSLVGAKERIEASERRIDVLNTQAQLIQLVAQDHDVVAGLTGHVPSLLDVIGAGGAALHYNGQVHSIGTTPPAEAIRALVRWLDQQATPTLALDSLPARYAPAHAWKHVGCGLAAASVPVGNSRVVDQPTWLLWFRPELAQTVSWAGDPTKPVASAGTGARIHPRTSFELWREEVHLRSAPFTLADIEATGALANAIAQVILEIEAGRKLAHNTLVIEESHRKLVQQIEDNRKVETELRRAQKLEAVGRLAAGIAHEINTPLQFVNNGIEFLRDAAIDLLSVVAELTCAHGVTSVDVDYLRDQTPSAVDRALAGTRRVATIVDALKRFAREDHNVKGLANLNEALAVALEVAQSEVRNVANVSLELHPLPMIPCFLGDLHQVFLSLLVNAAHAIKDTLGPSRTRGAIAIKSWHDGADLFITISDDGGGIAEAIRESVFLPFFSTKEVGHGMGQGLAISHAIIVEKHHGSLSFESQPGRGTVFTIRLPTANAEPAAAR